MDGVKSYLLKLRTIKNIVGEVAVDLQVASPLKANLLSGQELGLMGDHQYINAGLAVALCRAWLQRTGYPDVTCMHQMSSLPDQFIKGCLQGRAQVVPDRPRSLENSGGLTFYLDGAHTPESMEVCARWFPLAVQEGEVRQMTEHRHHSGSGSTINLGNKDSDGSNQNLTTQILLFNCMSVREPKLLLPPLMNMCASYGVYFKMAIFVPNTLVYYEVVSRTLQPSASQVDKSWQFTVQRVWESLVQERKGGEHSSCDSPNDEVKDDLEGCVKRHENSAVFTSLPLAIKWLRDNAQRKRSVKFQVLVTGSLHLVGDVLRIVKG